MGGVRSQWAAWRAGRVAGSSRRPPPHHAPTWQLPGGVDVLQVAGPHLQVDHRLGYEVGDHVHHGGGATAGEDPCSPTTGGSGDATGRATQPSAVAVWAGVPGRLADEARSDQPPAQDGAHEGQAGLHRRACADPWTTKPWRHWCEGGDRSAQLTDGWGPTYAGRAQAVTLAARSGGSGDTCPADR